MAPHAQSPRTSPRGVTKQQFRTMLVADMALCLVATVLLVVSHELYYLKTTLLTKPRKRMLLLETLSAICESIALTLWYCLALSSHRIPLVDRAATWLIGRIASRCGHHVFYEPVALANSGWDSESDVEMAATAVAEVSARRSVPAASGSRARAKRGCHLIRRALVRLVTHPMCPLIVFSSIVAHIYVTGHRTHPSGAASSSQEGYISLRTSLAMLMVVPPCVTLIAVRQVQRCAAADIIPHRVMITISAVIVGGFCVLAYTSTHAYVRAYLTFDTVQHMSARVLGGHEDFCGAVGMHTRKALAKHWVWPVVMPGWFRGGTRPKHRCGKRKRHQYALSYLDRDTDTLVVSTQCWSSAPQPSVLLEWPSGVRDLSPEKPYGVLYRRYVEEKYGTAEKARAAGVVVRRNRKTRQIDEVELDPALLKPVERRAAAPGSAEAAVRAHWRSPSTVLEIPLGASASYTVRCPRVDAAYRELHLYPLDPRARGSSGVAHDDRVLPTASRIGRDEPPGSVLFILQDAVSHQEAVRSLPLFSEWMRQFRDRQARKANGTGFVVAEPLHHATAGMNSLENIPPMICGATMSTLQIYFGPQRTNGTRPQAPNETIFYEFKSRYGETVETTLTTAACMDIVGADCDTPLLPGSGHAHLAGGIDRHLYFPFCDREYADEHVYVPTPRCMAGRTPAKHSHDYISHLLGKRARLSEGSAPHPRFFFDIAYFLEGHERSQTVLASEDRQLRDFMRHLEEDLHFFDNPHNAFILGSDHGIHYGNYFTGSLAGQLERTTPMMLFAFHPEMMRRVDQMKNRTEGTSLKNFQKRLGGFNSQYDLGMTLHDILGIPDLGLRLYENNTIKPASYFDVRDEVPLQCYDYRGPMPDSPSCTLDYCEK